MDDITTCYERGGQPEWDNNDYSRDFVYLGIRRDRMYPISSDMQKRLDNDYQYHAPKGDQQQRYILIRDTAKQLATVIVQNTPASREQSVALTDLDKVVMTANAAIARNE